jgi:hypothetical protein
MAEKLNIAMPERIMRVGIRQNLTPNPRARFAHMKLLVVNIYALLLLDLCP